MTQGNLARRLAEARRDLVPRLVVDLQRQSNLTATLIFRALCLGDLSLVKLTILGCWPSAGSSYSERPDSDCDRFRQPPRTNPALS